ncbi:MFS transporter [Jatrophihabitans sp.]|uniref:MFS transporter n=1 Tax=Jatrophihabitans sp. TaxID=1932789 RepID=UPI0030C6CB95|nr:putative transporter [Jatrophihabitans sp.]
MTAAELRRDTFSSLRNLNYRRYASGQAISLIGTWMQQVAQSWLVLQLTGSATDLGVVVALQTLPVLLLGPYGGVVADQMDKRKLMIGLQSMMGTLALALGLLTVTHNVTLWEVEVLALLLGLNNCFENPARQSFVLEMVGPDDLRNAISINSVLVNAARAIGPGVAGIVIAAGGTGLCFLLNAASFAAVVVSLMRLDVSALHPAKPTGRGPGQLRQGLAYVRRTPVLALTLLMMGLIGCFAWEFQVSLPVMASRTFSSGSAAYGFMTAAMGAGAVVGGLWVAARGTTGLPALVRSSVAFGLAMLAATVAPDLITELVALALVGAAGVSVMSKGNSTLQLNSEPTMRGRVMALWAVAFMGSTPIGGPIVGAVAENFGGRAGLAVGAVACLLAALLGGLAARRLRLSTAPLRAGEPGVDSVAEAGAGKTRAVDAGAVEAGAVEAGA